MRHASLFSGIGGFDLAAQWMGWENVFQCEIDPFCQKVLRYHFPSAHQYGDIRTIDGATWRGRIGVLTGGFPCQPFSAAGQRRGKDDDRHLWPEMLRVIREIQPAWVVAENVRGLLTIDDGLVFEGVCSDMEGLGYAVQPLVIPACAVGAPHRRDRIWFVAHRDDRQHDGQDGAVQSRGVAPDDGFVPSADSQSLECERSGAARGRGNGPADDDLSSGHPVSPSTNPRSETGSSRSTAGEPDRDVANPESQRRREGRPEPAGEQGGSDPTECGCNDPNADRLGSLRTRVPVFAAEGRVPRSGSDPAGCGGDDADAQRSGLEGQEHDAGGHGPECSWQESWLSAATRLCGVDDGLPGGLDGITVPRWRRESLKAYGNAIVPQVAHQVFQAIEASPR